jgi:hypothetical protein
LLEDLLFEVLAFLSDLPEWPFDLLLEAEALRLVDLFFEVVFFYDFELDFDLDLDALDLWLEDFP